MTEEADEYGRPFSGGFRIVDPTRRGHQEVQVFVGVSPGARGNAGALTLREGRELEWFMARLEAAGFDRLEPTWPEGRPR